LLFPKVGEIVDYKTRDYSDYRQGDNKLKHSEAGLMVLGRFHALYLIVSDAGYQMPDVECQMLVLGCLFK